MPLPPEAAVAESFRVRAMRDTMSRYDFRLAELDDIDGIVALWPEHWAEAHYSDRGLVPDEGKYRAWMRRVIESGHMPFVVAVAGSEIVGFISYSLDHNFSTQPCAVLDKFFVRHADRRSAVPMILLDLVLDLAKADGAAAFHAPISTESQSSRSLENTLAKKGFKFVGPIFGKAL